MSIYISVMPSLPANTTPLHRTLPQIASSSSLRRQEQAFRPCFSCRRESQAPSGVTRREAFAALTATLGACQALLLQGQVATAAEAPSGLGDVVNATEGVQQEEKIAISSTSSTETLAKRDDGQKLPEGEFKSLQDATLAYSFSYPVSIEGKKLPVILSRRPERYSSAPPLAPDARQRIVSELVDFSNGLVITMTVGPPSGTLKGRTPAEWKPKEVANTVLIDKSTARVTEGQRVALQQVENVKAEQKDGTTYWTYEHLSQGSPNMQNLSKETYRHAIAVTAWRPGLNNIPYLYTLNLSCPDEVWDKYSGLYEQAAKTFKLTQPSKGYIPPDKDPWRFF